MELMSYKELSNLVLIGNIIQFFALAIGIIFFIVLCLKWKNRKLLYTSIILIVLSVVIFVGAIVMNLRAYILTGHYKMKNTDMTITSGQEYDKEDFRQFDTDPEIIQIHNVVWNEGNGTTTYTPDGGIILNGEGEVEILFYTSYDETDGPQGYRSIYEVTK